MTMRNIMMTSTLLMLILVGCQTQPTIPPQPTPTSLHVILSSAIQHRLEDPLHSCASALAPQITLFTSTSPARFPDLDSSDLILWWGPPYQYPQLSQGSLTAFQLDTMALKVVVHQENPLSSLTVQQLSAIFSGEIQRWSSLDPQLPDRQIQLFSYPETHPYRDFLEGVLLPSRDLSPRARIVPDPQALQTAFTDAADGIGYLPDDLVSRDVKELPRTGGPLAQYPVLGITAANPPAHLLPLIQCLKSEMGP